MKAKNLLLIAITVLLAIITSSCEKEQPLDSRPPYGFQFHFVDNTGKPLITAENLDLFISNYSIIHNDEIFKVNKETGIGYLPQEDGSYVFYYGLWDLDNLEDSFIIDYNNGTYDIISFIIKNYYQNNPSCSIYFNDKKIDVGRGSFSITIVKPADFFENLKNL